VVAAVASTKTVRIAVDAPVATLADVASTLAMRAADAVPPATAAPEAMMPTPADATVAAVIVLAASTFAVR
jgi:hypothetical protein